MHESTNNEYPPNPKNSCDNTSKKGFSLIPPRILTRQPTNVIIKDIIVDIRLPFVSEMIFIHINPIKDPTENIVWYETLSICRSQ